MPLIEILVVVLVAALILWLVRYLSPDPMITKIATVVVIVLVAIWLLSLLLGYPTPTLRLR